ncbi:type II toxin-antitoxin system HipA family toxin [Candidatus Rhabdochlamydia sp. T3358]|uniref:type II toxin-antitoxin system HipA family toxin n=1 Tax=Candidatus Rhabdochlamydia sp. T3358 TaxID=2099795 RepID=UPI0010BA59DD|nr:type II toxin-antitoxin system HipA family toxin [Candidatus Rhabdochlamydia sp. T3358]VHO00887.1 putative DNA-binding transcriptional regulator [Candidatus Rhabdochlamydia sp. T3358]
MTFQNTSVVHVYFIRGQEKLSMGRLVLKDRRIFFEYTLEFIKTGLELSPLKLPLQSGIILCEDRVFEGLFGVFNDSLPDGWGKLLLDRKLMSLSLNPGDLSPLDRLCYVGKNGMGALVYEPEIEGMKPLYHANLDEIGNEVMQFQENEDNRFVDDLLAMNGSSSGARPKIMMTIDKEDYLIKFRSSSDPKDIGLIEYAYHLMAKAAHLPVPEAKLFPSKKEPGYFGVKRFDRVAGRRVHMHTISGLLHADYRFPSLDYETIMKATLWLTKDSQEGEKQFRAAVFNVLSHNRDDHAKNFSFLMDEKGTWRVSPAYDLTFSSGPGGEHCSMIMREGKNPTLYHLLKLAEISNIREQKALQIIDEVKMAVAEWGNFAKELGVSPDSLKMIQLALNRVAKNVFS